jgi:hypothetical protein
MRGASFRGDAEAAFGAFCANDEGNAIEARAVAVDGLERCFR